MLHSKRAKTCDFAARLGLELRDLVPEVKEVSSEATEGMPELYLVIILVDLMRGTNATRRQHVLDLAARFLRARAAVEATTAVEQVDALTWEAA